MSSHSGSLLSETRSALNLTQVELARLIGVSRSTGQRLDAGRASLSQAQYFQLAKAVYPRDAALAAQLASRGGTTLEALGLVPPVTPTPATSPAQLAESVLCAAAEAMDLSPRLVRVGLLAAMARARELGVSNEVIEAALRAMEAAALKPA
jgi:transcriptional regulator with XRE-family HTH domain